MRTRLLAVWAAAYNLAMALADRFRPLDEVGPDTIDEVDEFVADMRRSAPDEVDTETSPIFDVLAEEWPALWARRERALRMPTVEMRAVFDDMTALLAFDYVCTHCETAGHHTDCPGCACSCMLVVA